MSYVKSKKSFEVRGGIFLLFCRVQKKHTTILILCRVLKKSTQQTQGFAVCHEFAVCLFVDTRQSCFLPCVREIAHGKLVGTRQM